MAHGSKAFWRVCCSSCSSGRPAVQLSHNGVARAVRRLAPPSSSSASVATTTIAASARRSRHAAQSVSSLIRFARKPCSGSDRFRRQRWCCHSRSRRVDECPPAEPLVVSAPRPEQICAPQGAEPSIGTSARARPRHRRPPPRRRRVTPRLHRRQLPFARPAARHSSWVPSSARELVVWRGGRPRSSAGSGTRALIESFARSHPFVSRLS